MRNEYKRRPGKRRRELSPYASAIARGESVVNRAAHALIDHASYVSILYDPDSKTLGIKWPSQSDYTNRTFALRRYGRGKLSRVIRA